MALTDKNIVITPNIGQTADPKIVFSGADASTAPQNITLQVYPTNNGTLSFEGSAGQLFSINNSMSGTIYSVNDVSGIPSIEVLDTGLIKLGQYSGNVVIGSAVDNATDKLQVTGTTTISAGTADSPLSLTVSDSAWNYISFKHGTTRKAYFGLDSLGAPIIGSDSGVIGFTGNYVQSDASFRAPIFYDSNNTAYYIDAASTSNLNGLTVTGTITGSISGNAATATTLQNARTIGMTGDVTWTSASFNGSSNVTGTATLANSGATAGTYNNVTVNAKGLVTSGSNASYLTSYTETDTLATVTGRGATTATAISLTNTGTSLSASGSLSVYQAITFGNASRYSAINTTIQGAGAGDKLILFNQSNYDARMLVGTNYDFLFKSQGNAAGLGSYKFYSGPSAALAMTIGADQNVTITGSLFAASKSFLIPHPTKPGMQLRYGSLEGPENGVYIRGKLKGKSKIELPEYWTKLVDPDSITVTLTPIGKHQKLYVEDIADNVVTVANDGLFAGEINCFFVVYGERVDVDKLIVEIE